jgi:GNAT superfamily N-acetyltransferase
MRITEITDPTEADIAMLCELRTTITAHDAPWMPPPTERALRVDLTLGWDGEAPRVYVGEHDGRLVAVGALELPQRDNRHLAWCDVRVHPDVRRQGVGSEVLRHLMEVARDAGRRSAGTDGWESSSTIEFAERHGFECRSQAILRRLHVGQLNTDQVAKLVDEAAAEASAYELVRVKGHTPDALIEQVAEVTGAINDAPTDDLDVEDEVFPVERIRAYEHAIAARGQALYRLLARSTATGELAGQTIVAVHGDRPGLAHQHDTSVVRAHRGHRLGQLLKAGMLQWLADEQPQLEHIDTFNAESNDHMIDINERLGYVVVARELEFQRNL